MAQKTEGVHYSLPMAKLFPDDPNAKIMDCFLSNYNIVQSLDHIVRFTGLGTNEVKPGVELLVKDKLINLSGDGYITNFKSNRLIGLYSYYRATLKSNLSNVFSRN